MVKNFINSIVQRRFNQASMAILWVESFIFSAIYGAMFHSWPVFGVLFLGLAALMSRPKTAVYTIFVLCFLWSFVFASIGYGIGGAAGAVILGGIVFLNGVKLHFRDLRSSWDDAGFAGYANAEWRQNWHGGQQNLN